MILRSRPELSLISMFLYFISNFGSIKEILEAAGASLAHLIDMQVFLVNMSDYAGFNEVYNEFFDPKTGIYRSRDLSYFECRSI